MNGGKDVKIGHDKRPISTVSKSDVPLYNYQTGRILVDESGNPLVTDQDEFFLSDATGARSTSVVLGKDPSSGYTYTKHSFVGVVTSTYGADLDVYVGSASSLPVLQVDGNVVGAAKTVLQPSGYFITIDGHPGISTLSDGLVEVKTANESGGGERNRLYFGDSIGIQTVTGVKIGDKITGSNIPDGSFVTRVNPARLIISNDINSGKQSSSIRIRRSEEAAYKADTIIKIEEQFRESSEVSTTLLGIDRAETQLSLFSNVSSYGLDITEFEQFSYNGGIDLPEWRKRSNLTYGNRYDARIGEETMESAISIGTFPCPFSFPFGPNFEDLGFYQETRFGLYKNFIKMGNLLYSYFAGNIGGQGFGQEWANNFLDPAIVNLNPTATDVEYRAGISTSFSNVDNWTETWRNIKQNPNFVDPNGNRFDDIAIEKLNISGFSDDYKTSTTRPGYNENFARYATIQSRRVFRYQPGRISGFTFGVKSSDEPVAGYVLEWGITNPTDAYLFHVYGGQISIRRRSTVALDNTSIERSGLNPLDNTVSMDGVTYSGIQPQIGSSDAIYGSPQPLFNLDIPRDRWNGDRLDGNGVSGYQLLTDRVTMWKIEFGWYGAIGVRFYAYVPIDSGDARWVVLHTIVIENSLGQACLQDSYFRLKYICDVFNTAEITKPVFLYKYGASYYIDGGDEGAQTVFSVNSGIKSTFTGVQKPVLGITPKAFITSGSGVEIRNRKLIIPKQVNISSDSLTEVQVVTCTACPGFAHAYTPGVGSTITGREVKITLDGDNQVSGIGTSYFYKKDVGAKLITNGGLYNWYVKEVVESSKQASAFKRDGYDAYQTAVVHGFGPGPSDYPRFHPTSGGRTIENNQVLDRIAGIVTFTPTANQNLSIGGTFGYPMVDDGYPVRLSNYDTQFASDFALTGSKIEIQFLHPSPREVGGHHASDFYIGLTDKTPVVSAPDVLTGWNGVLWQDVNDINAGTDTQQIGVQTSTIPDKNVLYGEHTHDYAGYDQDGVENRENYWDRGVSYLRMGIDDRIPVPGGGDSGACSKLTFNVLDPREISGISQVQGNPDPSITDSDFYLLQNPPGTPLPSTIDEFDGGEVGVEVNGVKGASNATFEGIIQEYTVQGGDFAGQKVQYIKISQSLGTSFESGEFSIFIRTVQIQAESMPTKTKVYNFSPWPLHLVGKMKDNSQINNITVKESVGDFERTITPRLYVQGNITVTNASNNATTLGEAPPHFKEVSRLSSALYDDQDEQTLRPGVVRDTFYVGANDSQVVDMSKIFNPDRDTITPDNLNLEATFFVAEKIDDGSAGQIEASVTYTEQ